MRFAIIVAVLSICGFAAHAAEGSIEEEVAKIDAIAETALAADVGEDLKGLYRADIEFSADSRERGAADAFADRFLADGMTFSNGQPPVVGPDAIREAMQDNTATWHWAPVAGKVDGDLGVTWGRAFLYVKGEDGAEDQTYRSRYVTVWERDDTGAWKIWIDLGTRASDEEY